MHERLHSLPNLLELQLRSVGNRFSLPRSVRLAWALGVCFVTKSIIINAYKKSDVGSSLPKGLMPLGFRSGTFAKIDCTATAHWSRAQRDRSACDKVAVKCHRYIELGSPFPRLELAKPHRFFYLCQTNSRLQDAPSSKLEVFDPCTAGSVRFKMWCVFVC